MKFIYKERIDNKRIIHVGPVKIAYYKRLKRSEVILKKDLGKYISIFLQNFYAPADIKCKSGKIKFLNEGNTELVRIFAEICKKHNLKWWCEWGTLLGAIRHNGYIPWDFDADVAMLRDDYEKFFNVVEEELKGTEVKINGISNINPGIGAILTLSNKTGNEFLNLDIVAWDLYYKPIQKNEVPEFVQKLRKTEDYINSMIPMKSSDLPITSRKQIADIYEKIKDYTKNILLDGKVVDEKKKPCVFRSYVKDLDVPTVVRNYDDMFPLQKHEFESYTFYIPNNYDSILTACYGNYLSFPPNFDLCIFEHLFNIIPNNAETIVNDLRKIHIK